MDVEFGVEDDTETLGDVFEVGEEEGPEATMAEPIAVRRQIQGLQLAFALLDGVDLKSRFTFRACVMHTVPHIMKGVFRLGLRVALEEVLGLGILNGAT